MVFGHPEGVVAALIHALGVLDDLVQRAAQFRLRIAALVDRGAGVPQIFHVDCAVIGAIEFRDHRVPSQMPASRYIRPGCCARAASGHAAVLPTSVMNSRRPMLSMAASSCSRSAALSAYCKMEGRVLRAGLNCSEPGSGG